MAPQYKLTYFQISAVAEPLRFLMKYGGIEFEDERIPSAQWLQLKPNMPFGQMPVLTINGKIYHQSLAMARFIAKKVKLVGKDEFEDLEIDAIVDTITDFRSKIAMYWYEEDLAIKESRKGPLMKETIPYYLERLDKIAAENKGHLACNKLTWADLHFVALLDYLNYMAGFDLTAKYANLEVVKKNVLNIPAIKEWCKTRPEDVHD